MCGEEGNIRIERAGNGFLVDAYEPGKRGRNGERTPGEHKRSVATSPEHVVKIIHRHLGGRAKTIPRMDERNVASMRKASRRGKR